MLKLTPSGSIWDWYAEVQIPPNTGKVRVAMAPGGTYASGTASMERTNSASLVRGRKQAEELAKLINERKHNGEVEV